MEPVSARRVEIVLICEDSQHEAFARRFLDGMGFDTRQLQVVKSPSADGSAEQFVKERFPTELDAYRSRRTKAASALIAMIDADSKEVQDRVDEFKVSCQKRQIDGRRSDEAVAIVVPKRNIETWITYLNEQPVDESNAYPKLDRERACKGAVDALVERCKTTGLKPDAPPALAMACNEYRERIRPCIR